MLIYQAFLLLVIYTIAHSSKLQETDSYLSSVTKNILDGNVSTLTTLLNQSKDLPLLLSTEFNMGSLSPLQFASKMNSATIPLLLSLGSDPLQPHTETGTTPLIYTSRNGDMSGTELILKASKNLPSFHIDTPDTLGSSALNVVAITCNVEMASKLISHGARSDVPDHAGNTALHVGAWYCCDSEVGSYERGWGFAKALLKGLGDGDIDKLGGTGRTPLMLAGMRGGTGFWEALIVGGADERKVGSNKDGKSALQLREEYKQRTEL
jgi:hypothetical protein